MDTLARLNLVFQDVFDDEDLQVQRATTADDIEDWDSLMHVTLIVNVERAFGVRFPSSRVSKLADVGELVDLIDAVRAQ